MNSKDLGRLGSLMGTLKHACYFWLVDDLEMTKIKLAYDGFYFIEPIPDLHASSDLFLRLFVIEMNVFRAKDKENYSLGPWVPKL